MCLAKQIQHSQILVCNTSAYRVDNCHIRLGFNYWPRISTLAAHSLPNMSRQEPAQVFLMAQHS
jgi:hypothetical protein